MSPTKVTSSARSTEQRRVLQAILETSDRPLSVHEILALAQKEVKSLGLATVYRNLRSFVEDGWLAAVALPGEAVRYELASKKHHHHFHCESCERIFDIPHCARNVDLGLPRGFVVERHEILLHGLCPDCRMPG
jgi:Fur family ferric uptake transcriptional regulator